ncbi:hypothetical protein GQR58_015062 [Nymphon striatum]|nr:hypothetical protein GQR58_015062 [Nymphon striatum]
MSKFFNLFLFFFFSGEKSMDKTHPDYVPSIFPSTSTPTTWSATSELKMSRFERRNERTTKNGEKSMDKTHPDYVPSIFPSTSTPTTKSATSELKMSRFKRRNERNGEKSMDKIHPDYVPSIFPSTSTPTTKSAMSELKMSRFKRGNERPTKNGEKSMDKTHPDYVPSIFPSASTSTPTTKSAKSELKTSRFKRRNERPTKNATLLRRSPGKELLSVDQTMSLESDSTSDCSGDAPILQNSEQTQKPLFTSERAQLYSEINSLRKERDEAQAKILTLEQAQMTGVLCRLHLWKKMKKRVHR